MGIFSQKPKFKVAAPTVRVEKVLVDKPKPIPKPLSSKSLSAAAANGRLRASASPRPSHLGSAGGGRNKSKSASPLPSSSSADEHRRLTERKRKLVAATARPAPGGERVKFDDSDSGDEDDDGWKDALGDHKRRRRGGPDGEAPVDLERSLRHPNAFAPDGKAEEGPKEEGDGAIIHAADVASLALGCAPALRLPEDAVAVELQYPGGRQRER
jgi:H3 lysine-79-specific histone-lysine N-methyltransferase